MSSILIVITGYKRIFVVYKELLLFILPYCQLVYIICAILQLIRFESIPSTFYKAKMGQLAG